MSLVREIDQCFIGSKMFLSILLFHWIANFEKSKSNNWVLHSEWNYIENRRHLEYKLWDIAFYGGTLVDNEALIKVGDINIYAMETKYFICQTVNDK